ncbi:MAG: hypothetical protein A2X49_10635 [Lentisphaerae bacterium GWF2_52_8]|nr:MAG: hypothetical protein A2X49_10635 [Lentisphaerae bacterium GWF2_52_8]
MRATKSMFLVLLCSCSTVLAGGMTDAQKYPIPPGQAKANAERVASDMKSVPEAWKAAPCVYYEVPPMSPLKRLPDQFPSDGTFLGQLNFIAAQGEFEPASFVVYPFKNVEKFELKAGELRSGKNVIPASALDIKIVKVWYQAGSAWYGFFADRTQRVPIPELLLNDETLIKVDHITKDNYVRYECLDGTPRYAWMSFLSSAVNHSGTGQAKLSLISDSPTLLPASLEQGEFKQFFVTVGVPEKAVAGIYGGEIVLLADGKEIGKLPISLRVLPFQLPRPATYYDMNKEFYGSFYCQPLELECPKILRNLRDHNILNPMLPRAPLFQPKAFGRMIEQLKAAGLSTKPLIGAGPSAGFLTDDPPTPAQQQKLDTFKTEEADAVAASEKFAGHSGIYSYGYDEAGPSKILKERAAWRAVHESGGRTMVSSYPHGRLIFNLDYLIMPGMPVEKRKNAVNMWHDANPNSLVAWYANPHSGPENPDYFRRIHGMMSYKSNYDAISNYVWYRNNWNDFWVPAEANLRGLTVVYPTKDDVIDSLAWEGIREGMDDIRYATMLRQLAAKAMQSKNVDISYTGRKAMSWLAYWDETREDLNAGRLEMINYILKLDSALKGGK